MESIFVFFISRRTSVDAKFCSLSPRHNGGGGRGSIGLGGQRVDISRIIHFPREALEIGSNLSYYVHTCKVIQLT